VVSHAALSINLVLSCFAITVYKRVKLYMALVQSNKRTDILLQHVNSYDCMCYRVL